MNNGLGVPYLWTVPDDYPQELIGNYVRDVSPDRFEFRKAVVLPRTIGTPAFRFAGSPEVLAAWDALPNDALLPLVNSRLATVLRERAANDTQLVPADVETSAGRSSGYFVVNVTHAVLAIDHTASEYTLVRGTSQIMGFRKLQHKPGSLAGHEVARDEEYKSHILISEDLGQLMLRLGVRGVAPKRATEMSW